MNHQKNFENYDPKKEASFFDRLEVYKNVLDYIRRTPENDQGLCTILIVYYLKGSFSPHCFDMEYAKENGISKRISFLNTTVTFPELIKLVPDSFACYNRDYTNEERISFLEETIKIMEELAHMAQRV